MPATAHKRPALKLGAAMLPLAAAAFTASTLIASPASATTAATTAVQKAPTMEPQQTLKAKYHKPKVDARIKRMLSIARGQQGDPYSYGSAGPNAFDCSGLVFFSTHAAGYRGVPRTSGAQSGYMRHIPKSAMKPGDFVFFSDGGGVYHVGIWVGGNNILHAPYSGTRVRVDHLWTSSWFGGTLRGRH